MRRKNAVVIGLFAGLMLVAILVATPAAQSTATQIQVAINQLTTGVTPFTFARVAPNGYLNFGNVTGVNGYGLRDSSGMIQLKQMGDPGWTTIDPSGMGDLDASYITRVAETGLSNETALGGLASGLLLNTNGTGLPTIYAGTSCTNQFPRALAASGAATCATVALLTDTSGTLTVARGGTGMTSGTSGGIPYFTGTSSMASSGALGASQIVLGGGAGVTPSTPVALGTTVTVLHGNAAGAPTFGAVVLTTDVSGILPTANGGTANAFFTVSGPAASAKTFTFPNASSTVLTSNAAVTAVQGGTGQTGYAVGDLLQANTTTTLARLASVATGNALISGGVTTVSTWGKIGLTTHISGVLPVANGGTNIASYVVGDLIYASATTTLATRIAVAAGSFLRSAGVATPPVWSTTTWPNAATTGDLLTATGTNAYGNITAVATGRVLVSAGVAAVPTWSTALLISSINMGANLTFSSTAPTVMSGFGTSPTVAGTATSFVVDVGTGGVATDGVLSMPTATTGWNCSVNDLTSHVDNDGNQQTFQLSSTVSTVTVEHQNPSTGATVAWTAGDVLSFVCAAY